MPPSAAPADAQRADSTGQAGEALGGMPELLPLNHPALPRLTAATAGGCEGRVN